MGLYRELVQILRNRTARASKRTRAARVSKRTPWLKVPLLARGALVRSLARAVPSPVLAQDRGR